MPSAARVRWAKFRVTAVTVVSLLILGALLYELFGGLLAPQAEVFLYVPDATGLSNESPVRVDGIDVGRVSTVELSGSKDSSRAVKVTLSLHPGGKTIPGGGELIYKNQPELLRSLDLTQFTQQLRLVDASLTDIEQGRSQFGQFVQGEQFYDQLERKLLDLQAAFHAAVSTTSMVGGLLNSDQLHRQVSDLLVHVDQAVAKVQSGQGPAGKLLRDSAQYDQLLHATQGFRHSIEAWGSSDLLQSDRAYVSVNQWLAALIKSVDELNRNPLLATTAVYDNLNGSMKELQETLRDFRLNPKKYLRIKVF
jgi:phospholipid/cholesterol/gamma-HCH transport system substrate-binding protein